MAKQYKFMRVDPITLKNFNQKAKKINMQLKKMGVPSKVSTIDVTKIASKKILFLDNKELIKLSKRKINRI